MNIRKFHFFLLLPVFSLGLLTSCFTAFTIMNVTLPKTLESETTVIPEKIPLRMGLYMSDFFQNYRLPRNLPEGRQGEVFLGDALSSGSENLARNIFQETVILDKLESEEKLMERKLDAIISPQVVKIFKKGNDAPGPGTDQYLVQTTLKWDIVTMDGKVIYSTLIKGEGIQPASFTYSQQTREKELTAVYLSSLKDQFRRAEQDIYSNAWWKKPWWKEQKTK